MMKLLLCDPFYPSFLADLIISSLGAFIGIYGAYLIYQISVQRAMKDRLKYCASLIEAIVPSIRNQAERCITFADLLVKNPFSNDYLSLVASKDHKRLGEKVDQEGFFHAFLWKYKRSNETYKTFRNLYGRIDYLDSLWDDMLKTNERIIHHTWERKKQYQITFGKVHQKLKQLQMNKDVMKTQPEVVRAVSNVLQEFGKIPTTAENLVDSYKIVVDPLYQYITMNAKEDTSITEILFLLNELYNHYVGIELSAKHNAEDYKLYGEQLKEKADELFNLSTQLRSDFRTE